MTRVQVGVDMRTIACICVPLLVAGQFLESTSNCLVLLVGLRRNLKDPLQSRLSAANDLGFDRADRGFPGRRVWSPGRFAGLPAAGAKSAILWPRSLQAFAERSSRALQPWPLAEDQDELQRWLEAEYVSCLPDSRSECFIWQALKWEAFFVDCLGQELCR